MVRENYGQRRWGLPGGMVEDGESPGQAAVREAFEETCLRVELDHLVGMYHLRSRQAGTPEVGSGLRFVFAGAITGGELSIPETGEIADSRWLPTDGLPQPMTVSAWYGIADAVAQRAGVLRFLN